MIEVTLNGKYAGIEERQCDTCGCKYTFVGGDVKWVSRNSGTVSCPQCNEPNLCIFEGDYYRCNPVNASQNLL